MRLTAYKDAIDEARALPGDIPLLSSYFECSYSPRNQAIHFILDMARKDTRRLTHGEFLSLYEHHRRLEDEEEGDNK